MLVALGVKEGCTDGFSIAAKRCFEAGQFFPVLIIGLRIIAAENTPKCDVVVGNGTASDGHTHQLIGGFIESHLEVVGMIIHRG